MSISERVVVVGASNKPERYGYQAVTDLLSHGHVVVPVHPRIREVQGIPVLATLSEVQGHVDTVTLYVNAQTGMEMLPDIVTLKPKRVIMNPGTESDQMEATLRASHILVQRACTLVLLRTGQY